MKAQIKNRINDGLEKHFGMRIKAASPFRSADAYASIRFLRGWKEGDVIFDVGANDGRTVDELLRFFPKSRIHCFEPVAATFEKLQERASKEKNVSCHQVALGAAAGKADIYLHEKAIFNSFSKEWGEARGAETVTISTVDQTMKDEGIDYLHFLKIDTEGHELQVLEGAEEALQENRIGIIKAEVGLNPRVSMHTPLRHVIDLLAPSGYHLHGVFDQHRRGALIPEKARPYENEHFSPTVASYCDAIFVAADLSNFEKRHQGSA